MSSTDLSFAELISMREAQQRRIQASLKEQNEALKGQLGSMSPGSGGEGGGGGNVVVGSELLKYFEDLEKLITKNHQSDIAVFNALQDKFEAKQEALEQRMAELEGKLIQEERTKELLREEHMSQHLTLCQDLESLRSVAESNLKRLDARDETVSAVQSSVHAVNATISAIEERLVHVESIPSTMREEIHELDSRFTQMSAAVTAERASINKERSDIDEKQKEEFSLLIADGKRTLKNLEDNSMDVMESLTQARKRINEQITEGINATAASLESQIAGKLQEQTDLINSANQRMSMENMNAAQALDENTKEMQFKVNAALDEMRANYHGAVKEQMDEVVEKFNEYEERRKAEYPAAESDRVQLMLKELESAFVMLEGVARNSMTNGSKSGSGISSQWQQRIESLEAKLDDVKAAVENPKPIATFSIPVQVNADDLDIVSPEEMTHRKVEQNLQKELELAAAEQGSLQARKDAIATLNRIGANRRSASYDGSLSPSNLQSTSRSPTNKFGGAPETTRTSSVPNSQQGARSQSALTAPPPQPTFMDPKSFGVIRHQREQKEAAFEKIQSVLRDIQQKFNELTEKEQRGTKHTPDQKRVAQLIAQQKEAVYQKERQLIDHRNNLWKEISELREQEKQMSGQQY